MHQIVVLCNAESGVELVFSVTKSSTPGGRYRGNNGRGSGKADDVDVGLGPQRTAMHITKKFVSQQTRNTKSNQITERRDNDCAH